MLTTLPLLQYTYTNPLESSSSSTFSLTAPLQRYYNPLAFVFLGPFLGLQPWDFTREYEVCDLSHRGSEKCASLSLAAIKWVSYKIKRIFLPSTLSKQEISRTLLNVTFINLLDRKRQAITYRCTKLSKGEVLHTGYTYYSFISTGMLLFGFLWGMSVILKVKIHSVKILFTYISYFIMFTLSPLLF